MKMIKDLQRIRLETEQKENENWAFCSWLKYKEPDGLDEIVFALSRKCSSQINCQDCANCYSTLKIEVSDVDLEPMAEHQKISIEKFKTRHTEVDEEGDQVLCSPCPMLKGRSCSIYSSRPDTCRPYPHLEKPEFLHRLIGVIGNLSVCPIAFAVFEELKEILRWGGQR